MVPGCVTASELPAPKTTPEGVRHTLAPGDAADPNITVSLAHVNTPPGMMSAIGVTIKIEKLIMLSQP